MTDPNPEPTTRRPRSLIERISARLFRDLDDRDDLLQLLHDANDKHLIDSEALAMIEGVLEVAELTANDILIPRSKMDVIDITMTPEQFLPFVLKTGHSRFPVVENDRDSVIGILLAKDLLKWFKDPNLAVRSLLRPAVFIPQTKRLNVLLREFRANRNHMAVVVDEYGGVCGLVTIEDVLEEIVGEIEDEYDFDDHTEDILPVPHAPGRFRILGTTTLSHFNEIFGTSLHSDDVDTVAGLVQQQLGHVPAKGEIVDVASVRFEVLRSDGRQLKLLLAEKRADKMTTNHES